MPAKPGDSIYNILWKLVENAGGTPRPGDSERDLLAKYLTAIGGTPITGDTFYDLLVKVIQTLGGTPRPGDTVWGLLVKWLEQLGECRACGDSQHDLWRKILDAEEAISISAPEDLAITDIQPVFVEGEPEPQFFDVTLQWTAPTYVGGLMIEVWRDDGFGVIFSLTETVSGLVTTVTQRVPANIGFSWKVRSVRGALQSAFSNIVTM